MSKLHKSKLASDRVDIMAEVAAFLRRLASDYHGFISAGFRDDILRVHTDEATMMGTFAETATWEWRDDEKYPIRLVARLDGVDWFALFTAGRAAQYGYSLVM